MDLMVKRLRRPKKGSKATALNGSKAETILAMLSSGDTSQRGPLTVEGHVARIMKKLLDQVRVRPLKSLILCVAAPQGSLLVCLQCCKHQPSSFRARMSASRACLAARQSVCFCAWEAYFIHQDVMGDALSPVAPTYQCLCGRWISGKRSRRLQGRGRRRGRKKSRSSWHRRQENRPPLQRSLLLSKLHTPLLWVTGNIDLHMYVMCSCPAVAGQASQALLCRLWQM